MLGPRVSALPDDAREEADYAVRSIREDLREADGDTSAESIRRDALGRMLSLAGPRLRALVERQGAPTPDGTTKLSIEAGGIRYGLTLGTVQAAGRGGQGEMRPNLVLTAPTPEGRTGLLLSATFYSDRNGVIHCGASARNDRETDVMTALEGLAPHLPPDDGPPRPATFLDLSAEAAMVRADGGFPGPTCREFLDTLRTEFVRGTLANAGEALGRAAALQAEAGYVWGGRYLAYDDFDKMSCRLPVEGTVACFHLNVDLCDEHRCWIVGFEPGPDGQPSALSAWGYEWGGSDIPAAAEAAVADGLSALGEPHVSLDLATGEVRARAGFNPGALVSNVLHGATRDAEVFADLPRRCKRGGTETRSDFHAFAPGEPEEEVSGPRP